MSSCCDDDFPCQDRRGFLKTVGKGAAALVTVAGVQAEASPRPAGPPLAPGEQRAEIERRLNDPGLLAVGTRRIYREEHLRGISLPLGGIGGGNIQINGQAKRHIWQIFNNFDPLEVPNSFFAVRTVQNGSKPVMRALQTEAVGPFEAIESLTCSGEFPFGWFDFEDPALPVHVTLEAFSPLIPMDEKNSALPGAVFLLTAENHSRQPVEAAFLAAQQNAVGYRFAPAGEVFRSEPPPPGIQGRASQGYGKNRNAILSEESGMILSMTAGSPPDSPGHGTMALLGRGSGVTGSASWESLESLAGDFAADGKLSGPEKAGPTPQGETIDGALATRFMLAPGEKKTAAFLLTWHFPSGTQGVAVRTANPFGQKSWIHTGRMYTRWWPDALEAVRYLDRHLDELTQKTRLFHGSLFQSNLPRWLVDRIVSQVAILKSQTCYWAGDGYFGGWEGCNMTQGCCLGNCAHVWHYAQAHARLFPLIGRTMREQALFHQDPGGGIPFRQPAGMVAFDGQCGEILGAYREHLCSRDGDWLRRHWPGIRKAMNYVVDTWDKDEDGVPKGQQHNTLDAELSGSSSWLGTLYLAALAATEKMAGLEGDDDAARRYRRIRLAGARKQDAALFNGEYYIQIPDQPVEKLQGENYLTGCHIDQVLGQWWAHQLDLGWLYPAERVRTALKALFKYNFRTGFDEVKTYTRGSPRDGFPRKFVHDEDFAMMMTTWPRGGRPPKGKVLRFADEVMTGFEYSAAAALVSSGMLREALLVVRSVTDRYDGRLRENLTDRAWGYSGNPFGDDECGKFYSRAMSIWSMLLACQGFVYDGPAAKIGFKPAWRPEDHVSFFTAAEGWGVFFQKRDREAQTDRLELRYGALKVRDFLLERTGDSKQPQVSATLDGRSLRLSVTAAGAELKVTFEETQVMQAGSTLELVTRT